VSGPELSFSFAGARTDVFFVDEPRLPEAGVTVFDEHTAPLFGRGAANPVVLPSGEASKQWDSVERILRAAAEVPLGRDGTIAGVGGGVICDIAAFAASLYMRGCELALMPTTLLAMVDASLGGKTGIDFLGYKNLVGTFYPASRILVAPASLKSLPEREYLSGLAEVIKSAIIGDAELFALLEGSRRALLDRELSAVEEVVRRCLLVKGRIAEKDPREGSSRALLNLGHTFAHALESASGFTGWTHGEAVAWGIGRSLALGLRMGITQPGFARRVAALLRAYGFRLEAPIPLAELAPAMERDKKRRDGRPRLIVARSLCDLVVREASAGDLEAVLRIEEQGKELALS
jgi:3-dehydroquinate synthase